MTGSGSRSTGQAKGERAQAQGAWEQVLFSIVGRAAAS